MHLEMAGPYQEHAAHRRSILINCTQAGHLKRTTNQKVTLDYSDLMRSKAHWIPAQSETSSNACTQTFYRIEV